MMSVLGCEKSPETKRIVVIYLGSMKPFSEDEPGFFVGNASDE